MVSKNEFAVTRNCHDRSDRRLNCKTEANVVIVQAVYRAVLVSVFCHSVLHYGGRQRCHCALTPIIPLSTRCADHIKNSPSARQPASQLHPAWRSGLVSMQDKPVFAAMATLINTTTPSFLKTQRHHVIIVPVSSQRQLRSADRNRRHVPRHPLSTYVRSPGFCN